jgi:hypothetical protein
VGPANSLLSKLANNTLRKKFGPLSTGMLRLGIIDLYCPAFLEAEVNIPISTGEVAYLTLNTESGYGILGPINGAEESVALRRLEVEMSRTAAEFYRIAVDLEHSENALDLILLLKKGSDLSSR